MDMSMGTNAGGNPPDVLPTSDLLMKVIRNPITGDLLPDSIGLSSSLYTDLVFDYFVSPTGSDSNDGTLSGGDWQSLNKIQSLSFLAGTTTRILVRNGTYNKATDYFDLGLATVQAGSTLTIVFERGCAMDGSNTGGKNGFEIPGAVTWTLNIYGNGLWLHGYKDPTEVASPNGVGTRGTNVTNVYDVFATDCNDGFSAHDNSTLKLYRCLAAACLKSPYVNVSTSKFYAYNCYFSQAVGSSSLGLGGNTGGTGVQELYDCILSPNISGCVISLNNTKATRCRIGTLTKRVDISSAVMTNIIDSFVNVYADGDEKFSFLRCFGRASFRLRNNGEINVNNCNLIGPASGKSNFLYSDFDPGSSSKFTVNNNIFKGSWTFDSLQTAAKAGYLFTAGSTFKNNILNGGVAYSVLLTTAGGTNIAGTITSDPLIGSSDSFEMSDYAFLAGSPAISAGFGGGDIGYGSAASDNRHVDKTLKLSPEIVSGTSLADYVLKWTLWPELVLADDGTLFTTFVPNQIDLSTFVDLSWMRCGSKMGVIYSTPQDAATITKIDKAIGNT